MSLPLYSAEFWAVLIFAIMSIAIQFILSGLIFKRYSERHLKFVLNLGLTLLCYATGAIFAVFIQLFEATTVNLIFNNLLFVLSSTFFLNFCLEVFYQFSNQRNRLYLLLILVVGSVLGIFVPLTTSFIINPYVSILFGVVAFIPYILLLQNAILLKKRVEDAVKGRFTAMQLFVISFLTGSIIFFVNSPNFGITPTIQSLLYILTWFFDTIGWVALYFGFVRKVETEKIETK